LAERPEAAFYMVGGLEDVRRADAEA
jgi:hypothetical protein